VKAKRDVWKIMSTQVGTIHSVQV